MNGQLMVIATTQDQPPYMYMGKKLDYSNLHRLTNFMSDNKGYIAWRKERKRLEKIKEGIEKPFKPLQNLVKQYQAIGERLRASSYLPEQKALKDIMKSVGELNKTRDVVVKIKGNAPTVMTVANWDSDKTAKWNTEFKPKLVEKLKTFSKILFPM